MRNVKNRVGENDAENEKGTKGSDFCRSAGFGPAGCGVCKSVYAGFIFE